MSKPILERAAKLDRRRSATLFAALGDETRLRLLAKLGTGVPQSITQLTSGLPVTRSKTQTNPCFVTCATTSMGLPLWRTVSSLGAVAWS